MAILFTKTPIEACTRKVGGVVLDISSGTSFKIETSPNGGEILDAKVPDGKKWHIELSVVITETDIGD